MRTMVVSLAVLFLALLAAPASAQNGNVVYSNGMEPCNGGCVDAWPINQGFVTSDTIFLTGNAKVTGFDFWAWEFPTDKVLRIQWSITSSEFGGTTYGSGTALVRSDVLLGVNEYGFDVDKVTVTGLNVDLAGGTYWFNLSNAVTEDHNPVYWDENSGNDCHSPGCPSLASENQVGTIPSETFDVRGIYSTGGDEDSESQSGMPQPTSATSTSWMPLLAGIGAALRRLVQ